MWRPFDWKNPYHPRDWQMDFATKFVSKGDVTMSCEALINRQKSFEAGADAIIEGINKELGLFFKQISDINLVLWESSWGRLQCNAETADGKKYQSWAGCANEKMSIELILEALRGVNKQLK